MKNTKFVGKFERLSRFRNFTLEQNFSGIVGQKEEVSRRKFFGKELQRGVCFVKFLQVLRLAGEHHNGSSVLRGEVFLEKKSIPASDFSKKAVPGNVHSGIFAFLCKRIEPYERSRSRAEANCNKRGNEDRSFQKK